MPSIKERISAYHAISAVLDKGGIKGEFIFCRKNDRINELINKCRKSGVKVRKTDQDEISRAAAGSVHKGAVLLLYEDFPGNRRLKNRSLKEILDNDSDSNQLVVILDSITDPHNLGAVIRSADQFQVLCVIIPETRSAGGSGVVDQTSAGASRFIPLVSVKNINREIILLKEKGFWIYGADMNGRPASGTDLKGKVALVLGREGEGIHDLVRKNCDALISVPCSGHIDSLNVSVAAGVLMYEARRQQGFTYT